MKKVLIVEDEEDIRQALVGKFNHEGFNALEAQNGKEGLELALKERPDLILLDIKLPGMNGTEVKEKLGQFPETRDIAIIFITGLLDKDDEKELDHFMVGHFFLSKPFDTKQLLEEVEKRV